MKPIELTRRAAVIVVLASAAALASIVLLLRSDSQEPPAKQPLERSGNNVAGGPVSIQEPPEDAGGRRSPLPEQHESTVDATVSSNAPESQRALESPVEAPDPVRWVSNLHRPRTREEKLIRLQQVLKESAEREKERTKEYAHLKPYEVFVEDRPTEYALDEQMFETDNAEVAELYRQAASPIDTVADAGSCRAVTERLGRIRDREATRALVALLGVRREQDRWREASWVWTLQALRRHSTYFPLDDRTLEIADRMASLRAKFRYVVPADFGILGAYPRFEFNSHAIAIGNTIRLQRERVAIESRLGQMPRSEQPAFLADLTWNRDRDEERRLRALNRLSYEDLRKRDRASRVARTKLATFGAEAIPACLALAGGDGVIMRGDMCDFFAKQYEESQDEAFLWALWEMRAYGMLGNLNAISVAPAMLEFLESSNAFVGRDAPKTNEQRRIVSAIHAIGKLQYCPAVPFLKKVFWDGEHRHYKQAGSALFRIAPEGVDVLIDALDHSDRGVRLHASVVLNAVNSRTRAPANVDKARVLRALELYENKFPDDARRPLPP